MTNTEREALREAARLAAVEGPYSSALFEAVCAGARVNFRDLATPAAILSLLDDVEQLGRSASPVANGQITGIEALHKKASALIDNDTEPDIAALISHIPALCATVKHLRAQLKLSEDWRGTALRERDESERLLDAVRKRADTNHAALTDLQSLLEQLRAENARLTETIIKQADYRQEILRQSDFRLRAIQLCKDKAAEWEQSAGTKEHGPDGYNYSLCKRDAANELAAEIEKL